MKVDVPNKEINDGGFADPFDFLYVPAKIYKLLSLHLQVKQYANICIYLLARWIYWSIRSKTRQQYVNMRNNYMNTIPV